MKRGDIVAVVETQKGAIGIEIFETGRVEQMLVEVGAKVPVGTPLARIGSDQKSEPALAAVPRPAEGATPIAAAVVAAPSVPLPPRPRMVVEGVGRPHGASPRGNSHRSAASTSRPS